MSSLIEEFDKMSLTKESKKHYVYFGISVVMSECMLFQTLLHKQQLEHHITLHFITRDTTAELITQYTELLGRECEVTIDRIAFNDAFIVAGVSSIEEGIPYSGNPIKHITIALSEGKKPVHSPSVFSDLKRIEIIFKEPIKMTGTLYGFEK